MKIYYLITIVLLSFLNTHLNYSQEELIEIRKMVFDSKNELYYQNNSIVFQKKYNKRDEPILSTVSGLGGYIHPKICMPNFILYRNYMMAISRDKFCPNMEKDITNCPWKIKFECIDLKNYKRPKPGVWYVQSFITLNLLTIKSLKKVDEPIFYDFVVHQNSILLLIMIDGNLTIYEGAENICDNQWELKYSLDTSFKSDYFISYVNEEGEICMLHDTEGAFKIDLNSLELNKLRQTDKTKRNVVFDENEMKYYLIDDNTAACLIESENTIDYFNQSIKNNKNGK